MKKTNWILLIIAVIIIAVIILNWKKWFGKGGNGTKNTNNTNTSYIDAQTIADRLYELMKGFTYTYSSKSEVNDTIQKVIDSNNNDFIAVWNAFGNRDGDNLEQWVKGEWYIPSSVYDSLKNRAQTLGLN